MNADGNEKPQHWRAVPDDIAPNAAPVNEFIRPVVAGIRVHPPSSAVPRFFVLSIQEQSP
ncbi:MAG TPA: hypothetical protein VFV17_06105 [Usitatibacteraceae bacterium]|nr:hypothetical protein [Usitatibacteraceae bacterium]